MSFRGSFVVSLTEDDNNISHDQFIANNQSIDDEMIVVEDLVDDDDQPLTFDTLQADGSDLLKDKSAVFGGQGMYASQRSDLVNADMFDH